MGGQNERKYSCEKYRDERRLRILKPDKMFSNRMYLFKPLQFGHLLPTGCYGSNKDRPMSAFRRNSTLLP